MAHRIVEPIVTTENAPQHLHIDTASGCGRTNFHSQDRRRAGQKRFEAGQHIQFEFFDVNLDQRCVIDALIAQVIRRSANL